MKKLFFYFSVVLLTIAAGSCSKDDNSPEIIVKKELYVKASTVAIDIGQSVEFTAVDNQNQKVEGVEFYIDGIKAAHTFKFDKRGVYNVVAKKAGYQTSVPLGIMVGTTIAEKLTLEASKTEVEVGSKILFTVKVNEKGVSDYYIEELNSGLSNGDSWEANQVGVYQFRAFKQGYFSSDLVTIKVVEKAIPENQYFIYNGVQYGINAVIMEADVVSDEESEETPYIYKDVATGKSYQKYRIYANEGYKNIFTVVELMVYVSEGETGFILPDRTDPKNVVISGGAIVENGETKLYLLAKDLEVATCTWKKPFDFEEEIPGEMICKIISKDKSFQIMYDGIYDALKFKYVSAE